MKVGSGQGVVGLWVGGDQELLKGLHRLKGSENQLLEDKGFHI